MKSEGLIIRLQKRLERHHVRRVRTIARWLLDYFELNREFLYLTNQSNPCSESVLVSDLRDQLIQTGLFIVTTDTSEQKWKLYPTIQFLSILKQYKEARNMEAPTRQELKDSMYMLRSEVDNKLKTLAKNIIEKLDPPFTEEKYKQYTQETTHDDLWDK